MAKSMRSLSESLLELLQDADTDAVQMTLSAFINVLHFQIVIISTPTALKLLEALRPLFDNEHSQLQQLSMLLFQELMEATERSKSLKPHVYLSLVPFYFNWHNENQRVAEASWRALFGAARFLKWRDLEDLVTMEQPWRFPECLLEKDRSRVGQYVRQALPFLESPEEPLRKLAIKFLGEPQGPSPPRCSSAPAPAAAAAAGCGPGHVEPRVAPSACCRPVPAQPWGVPMREGPGLSPARAGGRVAGLAAPLRGTCASGA
ncbi:maestro heat-like repeat-containing protein family member 6 [Pipra filicauda]|uniref:Maestro heat-like repeat-containing protein family member 6 n=1 Tax=Pipra filicauda TaxID=649802 RepID=A0A7R5KUT3_9PASS|nr:maestro heat-like repeat-containing protein family member 6 [Pipra filicauda]